MKNGNQLRLPPALEIAIGKAAAEADQSVNTWIMRACEAALPPGAIAAAALEYIRAKNEASGR